MSEAKKKETVSSERLELESMDVIGERQSKLKNILPEAFTEGEMIDFDKLRRILGDTIEEGKERYGISWVGKSECFKNIQTPSLGTLSPVAEESVEFKATKNAIIEGDNLEVLKLLQKGYQNKVKFIYIDPPYNTGTDFIYPDNFSETLDTYLEYSNQIDSEGRRFSNNLETDGRFHSKWLSMMYPRLFLARNLLKEDGLIFISIDDNELHNLKSICLEIFGEENFVGQITWKNKYGAGALARGITPIHEYVLIFSKAPISSLDAPLLPEDHDNYSLKDENFAVRGGYMTQPLATKSKDDRPNLQFPIVWQGKEILPNKQWIWSKERVLDAMAKNQLVITEKNGKFSVRFKQYLKDESGKIRRGKPLSLMIGPYTQEGTKELEGLFQDVVFDFPKPSSLIKRLLSFRINDSDDKDFIVLDFFAGSGSTAQAVFDLNKEDGGTRRFILVQLPEPTGDDKFPTIAHITRERVRRCAAPKESDAQSQKQSNLFSEKDIHYDVGFRAFRLTKSNFKVWAPEAKSDVHFQEQLKIHSHNTHLADSQAMLFEILIKSGFEVSEDIEEVKVADDLLFSIQAGSLIAYLGHNISKGIIEDVVKRNPVRFICLDSAFAGNDQLKVNAVETFKAKGITFKTV